MFRRDFCEAEEIFVRRIRDEEEPWKLRSAQVVSHLHVQICLGKLFGKAPRKNDDGRVEEGDRCEENLPDIGEGALHIVEDVELLISGKREREIGKFTGKIGVSAEDFAIDEKASCGRISLGRKEYGAAVIGVRIVAARKPAIPTRATDAG